MPSEEGLGEATSLTGLIRICFMGWEIKEETRLEAL
jgi:hypothetical protein